MRHSCALRIERYASARRVESIRKKALAEGLFRRFAIGRIPLARAGCSASGWTRASSSTSFCRRAAMIKSLRTQLVLALCAVVSIVGIVQGISSYQLSKAGMSALLDMRLEQVANRLRGSLG